MTESVSSKNIESLRLNDFARASQSKKMGKAQIRGPRIGSREWLKQQAQRKMAK